MLPSSGPCGGSEGKFRTDRGLFPYPIPAYYMALIVPFDGSKLSEAALIRAVQFETVLEEAVAVVSVIPKNNTEYARERGWIGRTEPFDAETVVSHLERTVAERAPDATFQHIFVDRHAPRGTIANRIRRFARNHDASIVLIGSENAGRMVSGITVGASVASDSAYDTMIISHEILSEIKNSKKSVQPKKCSLELLDNSGYFCSHSVLAPSSLN